MPGYPRLGDSVKPLIPWFPPPVINIPLPFEIAGSDHVPLHGFGVLVALGFVVGSRVAMTRAARVGLSPDAINRLVSWLVVGTFVGGHVGYGLMYARDEYLADPRQFLYFWQGLSSMGGIFTCVVLTAIFVWREKLNPWAYADQLAFGFAIGWFLGRMGCFVAHDHPGTPTDFFLGVHGICPGYGPEVACHDMGLYEALWSLGVFGLFKLLDRAPRVPGFYALLFFVLYGPTRFLMDFMRPESTDVRWLMLTPAQWWVIVFFLVSLVLLVQRSRSGEPPIWAAPGSPAPKPAE
jgi:phosphatidylglycerol:prolipoprotein diacylglycerol transferase